MLQDKIFKLKGKVQHYAWGGYEFIPNWLGVANPEHKPFAEYWMGAHPSASSDIVTPNGNLSLNELVKGFSEITIGNKVQKQFGELPYLFKILDVREMLSIQVHPAKEEAVKGFEEEEIKGIPISAATRNYKDKNHKPEVMIALSEFWLLHGFLQQDSLRKVLQSLPEFKDFVSLFKNNDYKNLYQYVMQMSQSDVNTLLAPLVNRELQRKESNELSKEEPGWWVAKLYEHQTSIGNIDRGVFSIYFFNIVKINPGEAIFQGPGIPHAYLEGQNVELMANSDNVLRGGLTPKHVDVPELLKHTIFEGVAPNIMMGEEKRSGEKSYPCPVEDFGISKIELKQSQTYSNTASSLEIIVIIDGEMTISGKNNLSIKRGEAATILIGETYNISTPSRVIAYKAFVP
jgi:mannose-6-phosphate isomerase